MFLRVRYLLLLLKDWSRVVSGSIHPLKEPSTSLFATVAVANLGTLVATLMMRDTYILVIKIEQRCSEGHRPEAALPVTEGVQCSAPRGRQPPARLLSYVERSVCAAN